MRYSIVSTGCSKIHNLRPILLGLHACGDLSVNLMEAFLARVHAGTDAMLLSVPCCYHRVNL